MRASILLDFLIVSVSFSLRSHTVVCISFLRPLDPRLASLRSLSLFHSTLLYTICRPTLHVLSLSHVHTYIHCPSHTPSVTPTHALTHRARRAAHLRGAPRASQRTARNQRRRRVCRATRSAKGITMAHYGTLHSNRIYCLLHDSKRRGGGTPFSFFQTFPNTFR